MNAAKPLVCRLIYVSVDFVDTVRPNTCLTLEASVIA
jgi:hypothetical protein